MRIKIRIVEKERKRLTLTQYARVAYIGAGIGWLISGVAIMCSRCIISNAIACIAALFTVVNLVASSVCYRDTVDEMAAAHFDKAGHDAFTASIPFFAALIGLSIFDSVAAVLTPQVIGELGMAILHIVFGISFIRQEKAGE